MNIEIVKQEKDELEIKIDNQTIAEVLRVYLSQQGVKFVAWRKEHPTKPLFFKIQSDSGTVKKAISDAISTINKDCDKILKVLK